ncbi:MAG: short-chain dehydrogenase, partial [Mesorhizobium sp. SCN 65-12]
MKGLEGKTAIISGGATLIGEKCAAVLAGYGVNVVIADVNAEAGARVAAAIGSKASFIRTDITNDADIAALVATTVKRHGRLDFLVNVACTYLDNGVETGRADWLKALDVNIVGSVMLMQAARPHLAKARGAIVNFGSISARVAQVGRWVYPVSKAAILQLTRNQALDLAPDGIRV